MRKKFIYVFEYKGDSNSGEHDEVRRKVKPVWQFGERLVRIEELPQTSQEQPEPIQ